MADPTPVTPRPAATVILLRERPQSGEVEVYMLRRHRKSSFMGSAFVFPGGSADPGEDDLRVAAARELFEEAGVLLCDRGFSSKTRDAWRDAVNAGQRSLTELLGEHGASLAVDRLHYYAHWITPSIEGKRFATDFYLAVSPADQTPSPDNQEAVDELWVTPRDALDRAGELRLPPPQVRTLWELCDPAARGVDAVLDAAREREHDRHPIMPRLADSPDARGRVTLLLPWDPDYERRGTGEGIPMASDHALAKGPSRFVLEDMTWRLEPTSPGAD